MACSGLVPGDGRFWARVLFLHSARIGRKMEQVHGRIFGGRVFALQATVTTASTAAAGSADIVERQLKRTYGFISSHLTRALAHACGKYQLIFSILGNFFVSREQEFSLDSRDNRKWMKGEKTTPICAYKTCMGHTAYTGGRVDTPTFGPIFVLVVCTMTLQEIGARERLGTYLEILLVY